MSNICCCENPKRIINPYTDEVVYSACRTCNTCLNIRVKNWQDRIEKECTLHRYSAFITLTYDNDNLPYYQPTYIDEDNNLIWNSNRLDIDDEIVGNYPFHPVTHCEELDHNCVPHLCKQDIVKFLKRLRSSIDYYFKINNIHENGKIRYFFCGEYGPTTLRPHYHAIIWFDSETLSKIFEQLLLKSWSLGFVDYQFVNSSAPKYVAKYVAGSAHLPEILQFKSTRLFHLQSKAPIIGYTEEDGTRFQEEVINGNYGHVEYDVKKQTSVFVAPPLPLENRYFPKCRLYRFNSRSEKLRVYAFAYDIATEYKIDGKELSDIIYSHFDSAIDIHCMYACKRFCETYNSTPERYVDLLLAHYDRKVQYQLRQMYEYQIDYVDKYRMPLYHLLDFDLTVFERLPHTYNEFKKTKLNYILNSYGLDDVFIRKKLYKYNGYYGPEAHQLNHEVVYSLHQNVSLFYLHNLDLHKKIHEDSLKVKNKNDLLNTLKIS